MKYCPECKSELERRFIDGIDRRVCVSPGCRFVHWENPLPVVAGLVQFNGSIVLARNTKWPSGIFSLITGFLEKAESPEQAIARELKEELGLDCETLEFIGHYPFPEMNQILMAFWLKATGQLKTGNEISEIKQMSKEELRSYEFGPLYLTTEIVNDWLANNNKN